MNISAFNTVWFFIVFFLPGFVSIKVYELFVETEKKDFSKSTFEVMGFGALNLTVLALPLWLIFYNKWYENPVVFSLAILLSLCIFPYLLAFLWAKVIYRPWLLKYRIVPHRIKRPWDWFFSKGIKAWVIVTLSDGKKIGGLYADNSYASAAPFLEQIYLEQAWELTLEGEFIKPVENSKGVIILGKDISTLEFFTSGT